ncbi:MAG: GTP 3',8-cyclase MoaA [Planctomycetes bacterium]|nr:GTP 3',8-cyclase MoaA [Planctomycetota bacterium]
MSTEPDNLGRPLRNLRISVTDRCNLRCNYCMPEEEYSWLPKSDVLSFEEIMRLVDRFVEAGVNKVRITGGEPLLRQDLDKLIAMLAERPIKDLAMTTNGVLLAQRAAALKRAGLHRLTVSLDSLDPTTFALLSRRNDLARVLEGLAAARDAGFRHTKIDTVAIDGVNDRELPELIEYARSVDAEIRFIEYMDVGGATRWRMDRVLSRARILERVRDHFGGVTAVPRSDSAPAERFRLPDGTTFGVISSVTSPFCASCDRARLTADGMWFTCLYAAEGHDLRAMLRGGASDAELDAAVRAVWSYRADRGAEVRAGIPDRGALAQADDMRTNPHLEMHTRGG